MRKVRSHTAKRRRYSIRSLLFVLLMLGGQAALASHQASHETSAELSACVSCLASNACDELLNNSDEYASLKIVHVMAETGDRPVLARRTVSHTTIRAPPSNIS